LAGHLEVICGPMYAGKSEELIRRLRRAEIANQKTIVYKPRIDDRYDKSAIVSHSGLKAEAYAINTAYEICSDFYDVVAIDEAQFFNSEIIDVVNQLTKEKRVIVSGLDLTFNKQPFGYMPQLLAMAKFIVKLRSVCQKCGTEDAMYTQRILNGKPAPLDGETVKVGGMEQYEARCEQCWQAG